MSSEDVLDILKNEKSAIDRFKNQSLLKKQFGEEGVKIYLLIGEKKTVGEVLSSAGVTEERLVEVLEYMDQNDMIQIGAAQNVPQPPSVQETSVASSATPFPPSHQEEAEEEISREEIKKYKDLSPFEKIVFDKYGKTGLQVYGLIDGERTAEEILNETGISEVKLVEILEFMDKQGIINLEKPASSDTKELASDTGVVDNAALINLPEPLLEEEEAPPPVTPTDVDTAEVVPIDVPIKQQISTVGKISMDAELTFRYGSLGPKLFSAIDNRKDTVHLVLETGLSFDRMDDILAFLGQRGAMLFATLSLDDIRERYGLDGVKIYDNYGREGVLLYELIGRAKNLRDIVSYSRLAPERAAEIFLFIHKILGLEINLDKSALYRELGISEPVSKPPPPA